MFPWVSFVGRLKGELIRHPPPRKDVPGNQTRSESHLPVPYRDGAMSCRLALPTGFQETGMANLSQHKTAQPQLEKGFPPREANSLREKAGF